LTAVHNTPFGDIVDTEDDLQPLVFSMFHDAPRAVRLVAAALATAESAAGRLEARAAEGWTTLTELADTLVRERGISFKTAHAIAARLIVARAERPEHPLAALLRDVSMDSAATSIDYDEETLSEILSPRHFVQVRRTFGGPAPEETSRGAAASRVALEKDREWWAAATGALSDAERRLSERALLL
jgi:argininosuccinate lyase